MMTDEQQESFLEEQYQSINDNCYKSNYQVLFNIIAAKECFGKLNFKQSIYIDAKQFVKNYIKSSEDEDYGYDDIKLDKIHKVAKILPSKQRLSLLNTTRRYFVVSGYDTSQLSKMISLAEISV